MACFLACFGFSKKRKRRRISTRGLSDSSESKKGNRAEYEPVTMTRRSVRSDSESREKPKEKQISSKVKKKVSFNLNVRAYEPLPKSGPESDEEVEEETTSVSRYPSNHRYQNCNDSYDDDEEDDIQLDDSDLDDFDDDLDDLYEECDYQYNDDGQFYLREVEVSGLLVSSQDEIDIEKNCNARERSRYVCSVLNPVANLSQWKEVKERETLKFKNRRKENAPPPLQMSSSLKVSLDKVPLIPAPSSRLSKESMQENTVATSLSGWVSAQEMAARSPSCPLQERSGYMGKSNLYNTVCELDDQLMYKSRIHKGVA